MALFQSAPHYTSKTRRRWQDAPSHVPNDSIVHEEARPRNTKTGMGESERMLPAHMSMMTTSPAKEPRLCAR